MQQQGQVLAAKPPSLLVVQIDGKIQNIAARLGEINSKLAKKVSELVSPPPSPNAQANIAKVPSGWGEATIDRLDEVQAEIFNIEALMERLDSFI